MGFDPLRSTIDVSNGLPAEKSRLIEKRQYESFQGSKQRTASRLQLSKESTEKHQRSRRKLPLPFMEETVGLVGNWKEIGGNFVLEPTNGIAPVAVVHFLGGAFVGAAPHLSYRFLLESLADRGMIVVTTPYRLDLDYLRICDGIVAKSEAAFAHVKENYGSLPIVGVGHSCGALLHTLLSSLFPDIQRELNILISFNNRPVAHAVPAFHELIVPLSKQIMSEEGPNRGARQSVGFIRKYFDMAIELYSNSRISPTFVSDEILPLLRQGLEIVDQVPPLLKTIAEGQLEFSPNPASTKDVLRMMYRAKKTLLVQFQTDSLDETQELEKLLVEANTIMKMKLNRGLVDMEVERRLLDGTHISPLTQNILLEINPSSSFRVPETYNQLRNQFERNFMQTVNEVSNTISTFVLEYYSQPTYNIVKDHIAMQQKVMAAASESEDSDDTPPPSPRPPTSNTATKSPAEINFQSDTARQRAAQIQTQKRLAMEEAELRKKQRVQTLVATSMRRASTALANVPAQSWKGMQVLAANVVQVTTDRGRAITRLKGVALDNTNAAFRTGGQRLISSLLVLKETVLQAVLAVLIAIEAMWTFAAVRLEATGIALMSGGNYATRALVDLVGLLFRTFRSLNRAVFQRITAVFADTGRVSVAALEGMQQAGRETNRQVLSAFGTILKNLVDGCRRVVIGIARLSNNLSEGVQTLLHRTFNAIGGSAKSIFVGLTNMLRSTNQANNGAQAQTLTASFGNAAVVVSDGLSSARGLKMESVYDLSMGLVQQLIIATYLYFLPPPI